MQTAAGRATAARGPGRQTLTHRWGDLVRVDLLPKALTGCRAHQRVTHSPPPELHPPSRSAWRCLSPPSNHLEGAMGWRGRAGGAFPFPWTYGRSLAAEIRRRVPRGCRRRAGSGRWSCARWSCADCVSGHLLQLGPAGALGTAHPALLAAVLALLGPLSRLSSPPL